MEGFKYLYITGFFFLSSSLAHAVGPCAIYSVGGSLNDLVAYCSTPSGTLRTCHCNDWTTDSGSCGHVSDWLCGRGTTNPLMQVRQTNDDRVKAKRNPSQTVEAIAAGKVSSDLDTLDDKELNSK